MAKASEFDMAGRSDESEVTRRIEEVLRLILDGWQHHEIVREFAEKDPPVQERQVREYISRAHLLLVENQERNRKKLVVRHVAQRERLFKRCVDADDFKTALSVLTDLAKLRGLYPEKGVKELAKLALAQGMKIEELERRLRDAARTDSPPPSATGSPAGGDGSSTPADDGPADGVSE